MMPPSANSKSHKLCKCNINLAESKLVPVYLGPMQILVVNKILEIS